MKWLLLPALILVDVVTKLTIDTPRWGWHPFNDVQVFLSICVLLSIIPLVVWPISRFGASLIFAGGYLNLLWIAFADKVANPFVLGNTAFNLADLMLLIGASFCIGDTFIYIARQRFGAPNRVVY